MATRLYHNSGGRARAVAFFASLPAFLSPTAAHYVSPPLEFQVSFKYFYRSREWYSNFDIILDHPDGHFHFIGSTPAPPKRAMYCAYSTECSCSWDYGCFWDAD